MEPVFNRLSQEIPTSLQVNSASGKRVLRPDIIRRKPGALSKRSGSTAAI